MLEEHLLLLLDQSDEFSGGISIFTNRILGLVKKNGSLISLLFTMKIAREVGMVLNKQTNSMDRSSYTY